MEDHKEKKTGQGLGCLIRFAQIVMIVGGIIAIWFSVDEFITYFQVSYTGEGQIVNKSVSTGKGASYYVEVSYQFKNQYYTGERQVDSDSYEAYKIGDPIQLLISPDNPERFRLAEGEDDGIVTYSLVILLGLGILFLSYALGKMKKTTIKG